LKAARQVDTSCGNGVVYLHAGEEICPTNAAWPAHIGGIHMDKLDRRDSDTGPFDDESLESDVVVIVVLRTAAALHFAQSPYPMSETFEHVHANADVIVFEGGLENGGNMLIAIKAAVRAT
jgi:hypothetical protein